MAKLTLTDGTIFEGTTEEIFAITERYKGVKAGEPAKEITHNGVVYTLVDRKAQEGDVVIPTAESSSIFVIKDTPYVVEADDGRLYIEGYSVYSSQYNRTTETVLVYAPKAEAFKVGDKVIVLKAGEFGGVDVGQIGEVANSYAHVSDDKPEYSVRVDGADDDHDYFRPQDLRKATDEEIAEASAKARKEAIFTQAGRKPNEYRKGDIVRADKSLSNSLDGNVGVVEDVTHNAIGVRFYNGGKYSAVFFNDGGKATLIATVESRLDRN